MKYSDMKTVIFSCLKCIFNGFIHGYFIESNNMQYVLLIMVKIWLLALNIKWSCLFKHRILCITSFIYYLIGIAIDTMCLIEKNWNIPDQFLREAFYGYSILNIIEFGLLVTLVGSVLIGVFFQFFRDLRMTLCPKDRKKEIRMQIKTRNFITLFNRVTPISESGAV